VLGNPLLRLSLICQVQPRGAPVRAARARAKRSARNWMRTPVRFDGKPWCGRYERPTKRSGEHGRRKDRRQNLREARERLSIPFGLLGLPIRHSALSPRLHTGVEG
jgi:hypothetical protein